MTERRTPEAGRRATSGDPRATEPRVGRPPNRFGRVLTTNSTERRFTFMRSAFALIMVIALVKLFWVQTIGGTELAARAESQRQVHQVLPATRGAIVDLDGDPIAFTREARDLSIQPLVEQQNAEARRELDSTKPTWDELVVEIADEFEAVLGDAVDRDGIEAKLSSGGGFTYLVRNVDVTQANAIVRKFPMIGAERVDIREYPGGALAANVVGATTKSDEGKLIGLQGIESHFNDQLDGEDGRQTFDRAQDNTVIPGTLRNVTEPRDGDTIRLTLDADLQWHVQKAIQSAKDTSGAKSASAVVLDARTGEVRAMANDNTFNPAVGVGAELERGADLGNPAITSPFEPGSVQKIITAAAAIEAGLTHPDEVHSVDGSIRMEGVTVSDAWQHGPTPYTTTGIFGKSSNVGTLMLAQRVGKEPFSQYLEKFGLGQRTGIELAGESEGLVPDLQNWQGGTFANLPIGQGLSMTTLQMAGIYQTIANDGVRVPPRIVAERVGPDGESHPTERPEGERVVSTETARTVRDMFRAVVQSGPGAQAGTGPQAAVAGYQISGKTGTAQQIDPGCSCYSNSRYWITFAGILPADDPRYVIAVMLDAPSRGVLGASAAPLFHDIASWLVNRDNIPPSAPAPELVLQAR
ncbi:peptidoglycan D,D-transpeptidase FtsI family protein [Dietzia cinnamea]|uniref:peptidoglycan D,D-transpeptidase FtsI family protein n=1 Tax=Dietzia cinnamea TaxID=321318 RepID=UPI000D61192E|nr:penicillin-binding protein 2 [Dietzia cinnamea]PWD94889.1 cell division protein FtsI [Dietzia maris]MBM7231998.1 penicillin-binding protein 2 [Dietzia cinnamea]MCT2061379.1 penicillin-binding protein 2 [Dietzia cinnamea]MCT2173978.1 penicillin-binding protein 2 [Dietzia cinnamea]MCT2236238.1 penicillin-binding protein 2 [Dietzia cinnamea]